MITTFLLASLAQAYEVRVAIAPPSGSVLDVAFDGVQPGLAQTTDQPCGVVRRCRLSVVLRADGDQWLVEVEADTVHRPLFGHEHLELLAHPTFRVPKDQAATFFAGNMVPIVAPQEGDAADFSRISYRYVGVRVDALVTDDPVAPIPSS
jgi:hypothetical protein